MERVTENSLSAPNTPFFVAISGHKEASMAFSCLRLKVTCWGVKGQGEQAQQPFGAQRWALYKEANMDKLTGPQEHHEEFWVQQADVQ